MEQYQHAWMHSPKRRRLVKARSPGSGYVLNDGGACKIGRNGAAILKEADWPELRTISLCKHPIMQITTTSAKMVVAK
jgi:hypothetical protein